MPRGFRFLAFALLCLLPFQAAWGEYGQVAKSPMPRIEGEMHAGIVWRIATDYRGRYLASVGGDKTLRIWSLRDGRLLKVLRVPIGQGAEGKLFAVAVSPDGAKVAVGGLTGWAWEQKISIYLFDFKSGEITRRIPNLPGVVSHLAFSRSGNYLAAVTAKESELRVYRAADGALLARDKSYGDYVNWVDFDPSGRLVTASEDGFLRLYDASYRLSAKKDLGKGKPYSAQFSPDGRRILVGFRNLARIMVFSGKDLKALQVPDTTGVTRNLRAVAWSRDGRSILAAGSHWSKGMRAVRRWSERGVGAFVDFPASKSTITHILALPNGRVAYASADPAVGLLDAQGFPVFHNGRATAAFQRIGQRLLISPDATQVQFGYDPGGGSPAHFSVRHLQLQQGKGGGGGETKASGLSGNQKNQAKGQKGWLAPLTQHPKVEIKGLDKGKVVHVNGRELELKRNEVVHSVAIAPNGRFFLLGSSFYLRLYARNGREMWKYAAPGPTWGVNLSQDGKLAVAAFGDGTIRWFRIGHQKELLAFFPHYDKKRWVVWTPQKYFAASPGAEELIGWHVNRGRGRAAYFHPSSSFGKTYNRPDVIKKLLR
ncbi:MAG: WD40 repeat domain-containing protein [Magnetococcales bacterium]|nr:WD40 repeat domain-containing protein [Magnetococcales bacterium]